MIPMDSYANRPFPFERMGSESAPKIDENRCQHTSGVLSNWMAPQTWMRLFKVCKICVLCRVCCFISQVLSNVSEAHFSPWFRCDCSFTCTANCAVTGTTPIACMHFAATPSQSNISLQGGKRQTFTFRLFVFGVRCYMHNMHKAVNSIFCAALPRFHSHFELC